MPAFLFLLLLLLTSCKGLEAISPIAPNREGGNGEEEVVSSITPEMGGSNYAFIDLGRYATDPTDENWLSDVKTPVVHFHQFKQKVRSQLDFMIANGQRKISLPVWFGGSNFPCITWGHTVCPQNGKMPEVARTNLKDLLNEISNRPFHEVQIRLAGQGDADVNHWGSFKEDFYQSNKIFIDDVIATSEKALEGKKIKVFYDLGLELMGHPYVIDRPWVKEYLTKIWAHYIATFDVAKTVGFSFNHAHRDPTYESLKIFDESGVRPPRLAFDIYSERDKHLQNIQWVLILKGWGKDYPIFIQETYRNDIEVANDVKKAMSDLGLNIKTIMQWPLDSNSGSPHANSVDYKFDNYK